MSFTSFEYLLFFLLVIAAGVWVRGDVGRIWLLILASYVFYISWSPACAPLILFTTVMDYNIGRQLGLTDDPQRRRRLIAFSLTVSIGMLVFFKYANFLFDNLWAGMRLLGVSSSAPHWEVVLPAGISYFTFASMSYVLDVYYARSSPCRSLRDYVLFIAFFPKLLTGPIARARDFLPQLGQAMRVNAADVEIGIAYFMTGAVKKLVISDQIATHVNAIFNAPGQFDGFSLLQALLGYAIQIYCDFSGYTDMAIGCARILGIRLPENFQMPYSAVSVTEFWRRWHITLSTWFRDYVFLPLEIAMRQNPSPVLRSGISITLTMLLCGLWHGASWNFVIWGGIHGAALAIHQAWKAWNPLAGLRKSTSFQLTWTLVARMLTLGVVLLGWVFFRAPTWDSASEIIQRIVTWSHEGTRMFSPHILAALVAVLAVHLLINKDRNCIQELMARSLPVRVASYTVLALLLVCLAATDSPPFIYFQF